MKPRLDLSALKHVRPLELAIRFAFGGGITMAAGFLGEHFGPQIGGLFLAFPAILPATLTMTKNHEGRDKAVDDARGARFGAVGLGVFALVACWCARASFTAWLTLLLASTAWVLVSVGLWLTLRLPRFADSHSVHEKPTAHDRPVAPR